MDAVYAKLNILGIVQVLNHTPAEGDAVLVDEGVLGGVDVYNLKVDSRNIDYHTSSFFYCSFPEIKERHQWKSIR